MTFVKGEISHLVLHGGVREFKCRITSIGVKPIGAGQKSASGKDVLSLNRSVARNATDERVTSTESQVCALHRTLADFAGVTSQMPVPGQFPSGRRTHKCPDLL